MSKRKAKGNLGPAFAFFLLVAGLILISFLFRAFFLLKESKFDGTSHFTLEVVNKNEAQIISFSPKSESIGVLDVKDLKSSSLEIPLDAKIQSTQKISDKNLLSFLLKAAFDFQNLKEVNSIDILRLTLFSLGVKDSLVTEKVIDSSTSKVQVDSIISNFFIDPGMTEEKLNIEVVNATDVYGLGNKVANMVSNIGGNVILVSTGDLKTDSDIEFSKGSYTVDKLSSLFHLKKVSVQKLGLPDVIITIGKDLEQSSQSLLKDYVH